MAVLLPCVLPPFINVPLNRGPSSIHLLPGEPIQRPHQQYLEFARPGIPADPTELLLVGSLPGRLLEQVGHRHLKAPAFSPCSQGTQLIVGLLAWVGNSAKYGDFTYIHEREAPGRGIPGHAPELARPVSS